MGPGGSRGPSLKTSLHPQEHNSNRKQCERCSRICTGWGTRKEAGAIETGGVAPEGEHHAGRMNRLHRGVRGWLHPQVLQHSKQPGSPLFGDITLSESHGSGLRPAPNQNKLGQVPGHLGQGGGCQQRLTGSGTSRRLPCGMGTIWGPTWATRDGVFFSQRPRLIPFWRLQEGRFDLF